MLSFRPLALEDKAWIDPIVFRENSKSADYNFGNLYMWDLSYRQLVAQAGKRLLVKPKYGPLPFFVYPIGTGALRPVLEEMRSYSLEQGFPFKLRGVTIEHKALLEEAFPGCFAFEAEREYFDYIYSAEALATLSGKKLHAKRNHINRFEMVNSWNFKPLSPALFPQCMEFLTRWTNGNGAAVPQENTAMLRGFESWYALGLEGGALFVNDRLVAFTIGEKIASDTFNVHFEKADPDVNGAYPMVNREFVRLILSRHPEILYINREDDMGLENLRQAKQSYYPLFLVEKYTACWRDEP
jgi:hypothetical protein